MSTPEDPRIWHGLRAHLDDLASVATVPPIGSILDRRRSRRPLRAAVGLAGAGAIVVAIGLLLPALRPVTAPITGATPPSSSAPATAAALPTAVPVNAAELIGHSYLAINVTEQGEPFASVAEARLELQFDGAAQFFAGAGCNGMGGDYQVVDGRLVLTNTVVPLRACVGPGMRDEGWYYTFLQSSPTIIRDTTGLVLTSGETVVTYRDETAGASPAPSESTVSERELLATFDVLSELPGFQGGGLTPDGDQVLVYWNGEFGPEAQAAAKDANRRGAVVNVIPVPYSFDELRTIASTLGKALAAKGIDLQGHQIGGPFDAIVVWGSDLDASADARRLAEETAADVLPADLRFAIITSPGPLIPLRTRT